ncbi:Methyltransferase domain-containing protein [Hymenobacter daecheongensis DSM 21074]|uniref:Methyltransferase domain-containing protein n=1 Tax=Hymenobacter daecheongensis DSM 21074 TaxID=1121955 RepID=A0A1M6EG25_9BACT|nr:class I SAM-dependent methyltransferase [Hymenobacter daecheongensis]SHI84477.1 Methyltransferase domain-containing protein [Hymenobacter daecheongensis DSM 21074]
MSRTPAPDPVGHALMAFLRGNKAASLLVHSNVSEDEALPASYFFRTLWEMPELERTALEECRGRILDAGAGAGCHSLELLSRGFQVKAIDASPGAVQVLQERGVRHAACHNLFDAPAEGEHFDTILMLMNGLGLVGTLDGLEKFLVHARALLAPGGQILATSSDVSYLYEDEEGALMLNLNGPYYGEVEYSMTYGDETGPAFSWLFADAGIVQDYAEAAGYEVEFLGEDEQQQFLVRLTLRS